MARQLIERWRLAVLEIGLDLSERAARVRTTLSAYNGDQPRVMWSRSDPIGRYHIKAGPPPYRPQVPGEVVNAVAATMVADLRAEAALWLHLVPHYGLLGAVPWEQQLIAATGLPVFRVPDRLPTPLVRGTVWSGAIVIDAAPQTTWAASYVTSLIAHWQRAIPAPVEVDVFADAATATAVGGRLAHDGTVRIHEPRRAATISATRVPRRSAAPGRLHALPPAAVGGSIWADWIADGLAGRAVRAVHIVLDGSWDGAAPVLLASHDPEKPRRRTFADMVGVTDLMQFAQTIGAATVSFGAPPGGLDDAAVRLFADTVGQQRSGPTLFSSVADDPDGADLADTQAFLVDPAAARQTPRHASLFAYAQPEKLQPVLRQHVPDSIRGIPARPSPSVTEAWQKEADPTLAERFATSESVPSWVASTDQYLGAQWAALAESEIAGIPAGPTRKAYDTGAKEALDQIRDIVERHARPTS
jgi:hypothetical protein